MRITEAGCRYCGADLRDGPYTRRIAVVDQGLDCVVAYKCPDCGMKERASLGGIIANADPVVFKEIP